MTTSKKSHCLTSIAFPLLFTLLVSACGGGGGDGPPPPPLEAPNVAAITVFSGGAINAPPNTPYVSIRLCSPTDNSNCITIDNIMVDTGSVGLRVFARPANASALSTLNLTQQTVTGNPGDSPIAECLPFTQGVTWGPVKYATLQIGGPNNDGEIASNFAIQVIADPGFTSVPFSCDHDTNGNPITVFNDIASFGANGILGVGLFRNDCGASCTGPTPANVYYNCDIFGANCVIQAQSQANQVQNPVTLFATDNNGVIITLPSISNDGVSFVNGLLTFGIDTQSNNVSTNANTILVDNHPNSTTYGTFSTTLDDGSFYPFSFFDSGSNGYFFNPAVPIAQCFSYPGFYCPGGTLFYSATINGVAGSTSPANINFNIADASFLFSNPNTFAFNDLGGVTSNSTFDWGLPFFYGRSVFVAIDGGATTQAAGPYFGF